MTTDKLIKTPKVFISYAWSNSDKVLSLAERLMANGVEVILDKWDLKEGHDKYAFMEQSVNNPEVDKVLIICDQAYADKANSREGGVGDETAIISPEIYGNVAQEKFIPVIFEFDERGNPYLPAYIKTRIYIDLATEDNKYEENYEKLLRNIHGKPLHRKPAVGKVPEWLEQETTDFSVIRGLTKQIQGYTGDNENKIKFFSQGYKEAFIAALLSIEIKTDISADDALLMQIDTEKPLRDLFIDYLEVIIYNGLPLESIIPSFFEDVYNMTHDASGRHSYHLSDFEFYDFVLWELFICTATVLLYYEKYAELNCILTHTYFLRKSYFEITVENYSYAKFRKYCQTIERVCKPKCDNPNYHTLTGNILIKREKKPIITESSLVNADKILYQMFPVLQLQCQERHWFPVIYIYSTDNQPIWYKLKSKEYCHKVMPLFGVKTIEELKEAVNRNKPDPNVRHEGAWEEAPTILDSIKLDEIGSIN